MDRPPFEYVNMRDLEVDPSQLGDNAIVGLGTGFPETIQQPYSTTLVSTHPLVLAMHW